MTELEYRLASGQRHVTMDQLLQAYADLGYSFDRSMDCCGTATHVTGPMAGKTYIARSLYPVQTDNKVSAWNVEARRDEQYKQFQRLRNEIFAMDKAGKFIEV